MQFRYPVRLSKVRLPDQDRDRRAGPGPAAGPPVRSYTNSASSAELDETDDNAMIVQQQPWKHLCWQQSNLSQVVGEGGV